MRLQWKHIQLYIDEAIKRFLHVNNKLPIKFISMNEALNKEDKYYIYLEDIKLTDWYKHIGLSSKNFSVFRVIITPEFLDEHTQGIDLTAKIPANFTPDKKAVLRIAYAILVAWQRCFIEAYKLVAKNKSDINYTNAKNWYDSLK